MNPPISFNPADATPQMNVLYTQFGRTAMHLHIPLSTTIPQSFPTASYPRGAMEDFYTSALIMAVDDTHAHEADGARPIAHEDIAVHIDYTRHWMCSKPGGQKKISGFKIVSETGRQPASGKRRAFLLCFRREMWAL